MKINEIFSSIDGEGIRTGYPVTFIRTFGCSLICSYCFGSNKYGKYPKVTLPDLSKKPLDQVKPGDLILTFDNEGIKLVETTVKNVQKRMVSRYHSLATHNTNFIVTEEHPFFVQNNWKQVKDIVVGDKLKNACSKDYMQYCSNSSQSDLINKNTDVWTLKSEVSVVENSLISAAQQSEDKEVINLTCEPYNTFLVDDIFVHNCDTLYAVLPQTEEDKANAYKIMFVNEILDECEKLKNKKITFTGGEPLIQKDAPELVAVLLENGYEVNIETNGAENLSSFEDKLLDILKDDSLLSKLIYTLDYKCPSSKMEKLMDLSNLSFLRSKDVLKFVVGSQEDLDVMKSIVEQYNPDAEIFVSPVFGDIEPKELVEYVLKHDLQQVRVQIQLHKVLWPVNMRGV